MTECNLSEGPVEYKIVGHAKVGTNSRVTWTDNYQDATWIAFEWRQEGFRVDITRDGRLVV